MWYNTMKKIWIWVEDSKLRKAVITDVVITIFDEHDNVLIKITNPTPRTIRLIEQNIAEYGGKTISKDNPFTYMKGDAKHGDI